LVAAGLQARSIEVASLGERRPLDFAATGAAHDSNRRVEILIERRQDAADDLAAATRVSPACPSSARH
jgi:hypothetical protein